jgi:hypothetical protein
VRAGFEAAEASGGLDAAVTRALDLLETGLASYAVAEPYPTATSPSPSPHRAPVE